MNDVARPAILIWDWDNTLIDGWAGITAALNVVFAAFGHPPWTVQETRERARLSMRESFTALFGADAPRAIARFREAHEADHLRHLAVMPGADLALAAGAAWPQAVVSNKDGDALRREVEHLGWRGTFRAVVGAGDAAADKPHPAPIWHALRAIGAESGPNVWYVGDTMIDMRAARAAGCTAILVGDAAHEGGIDAMRERGAAPDLHFEDAHALAARLRAVAPG
jgi:phosphoglycolate phosphatase